MDNNKTKAEDANNSNLFNLTIPEKKVFYIDISKNNCISLIELNNSKFFNAKNNLLSNDQTIGAEINKFFEIITSNNDIFNTNIKVISSHISSSEYTKDKVEKAIDYFIETAQFEKYSTFVFSKNNIRHLGVLLCYSFKKFSSFRIKSLDSYINITNIIIESSPVDPIKDYQEYINNIEKQKKKINITKVQYWKNIQKRYFAPGVFIFLVEMMKTVIRLKFELEDFDKELFYFVLLIFQNKEIIFKKAKEIILNYSFAEYYKIAFDELQYKLIKNENIYGRFANNYNFGDESSFRHSWDFNVEYIYPNKANLAPSIKNDFSYSNAAVAIEDENDKIDQQEENIYTNLVPLYDLFFEIMLINANLVSSFIKTEKLTVIFHDNFLKENNTLLNDTLRIPFSSDVHFIDLFLLHKSSVSSVQEFNIEFNALDCVSFNKSMVLINSMNKLNTLRVSLFSPNEIYFPPGIFKLLYSINPNINEIFAQYKSKYDITIDETASSHIMIEHLSYTFEKNMFLFFYVLLHLKNLKELSIFADIPLIISSNDHYSITIVKFIFNIFIILNSKKSTYTKVKLLFPQIAFDSRKFPSIIDFLEDIKIGKKNKNLQYLNLQFQFYEINNIHKLLTTRLISLNLSSMDFYTFSAFVQYYSSYNFSIKAELKEVTIGMLQIVSKFEYIQKTLETFLGTHLKNLEKVKMYTHFEITKEEYEIFFSVVDRNWVKKSIFEFDKKQRKEITNFAQKYKNEVTYFAFEDDDNDKNKFKLAKTVEYVVIYKKVVYKTRTLKRIFAFLFQVNKAELNFQLI